MKTQTKTTARILLLSIAAFAAGSAAADTLQDDVRTATVRYDDVGVDRAAGAATLYRRIRNAAHEVCGNHAGRGAQLSARFEQCVDEAIERSVAQVDRTALTAHHARLNGKAVPIDVARK